MGRAEPGALLGGRYRLRAIVRRGAIGPVWLAGDELLYRDVVIREMPWTAQPDAAERVSRRERVAGEVRALARLEHPNIAVVHDVVDDDGRLWLVLQPAPYRFPFRPLSDAVRDDGPLRPDRAARIGLEVLGAIRVAHAADVLHRDIKPGNVLIGPADRVMLTGFGMVTADDGPPAAKPEIPAGSSFYLAPERANGEPATPAADLWSLGATLYAATEGRPPFDRDTAPGVLAAVVSEQPDPPSRAGPLWPVISGLLRKDPAARPDAADTEWLLRRVAGTPAAPGAAAEPARPVPAAGLTPGTDPARGTDPAPAAGQASAANLAPGGRADGGRDGAPANSAATTDPELTAPVMWAADGESAQTRPDFVPGFGLRSDAPAGTDPAWQHPAAAKERRPAGRFPRRGRRRQWWILCAGAAVGIAVIVVAGLGLALKGPPGHQVAAPGGRTARPGHPVAGARRHKAAPPAPAARTGARRATLPGSVVPGPSRAVALAPGTAAPSPGGEAALQPGGGASGQLPAGFSWYHDPTGFSIGVPVGWRVSHQGHLVYVEDPSSARFLIVDQTRHPKPSPLADWRQQEAARIGTYPGYHRIRLRAVHYAQAERAADWEFTYYDNGQLTQVLNRNILANAHHAYALYWSAPASEWTASFHYFRAFAATFHPVGDQQG